MSIQENSVSGFDEPNFGEFNLNDFISGVVEQGKTLFFFGIILKY